MSKAKLEDFLGEYFYTFAKQVYLNLRTIFALPYGYIKFKLNGNTAEAAYQSMIWLFCQTQGRFNDWISTWISWNRPFLPLPERRGLLGDMSDSEYIYNVVSEIRDKGFKVFPSCVPISMLDRLKLFAENTPALIRRMDSQNGSLHIGKEIYKGGIPNAIRYDYDAYDLINNEDIQELLADQSILSVVQAYLNCQPVADVLSMWWHTNYSDTPDSMAAQYFHFDMDRLKWLKIFIYITDVESDNGPHVFVEGSHATGGIPSSMLKRGYVRIMDDEIFSTYPSEKIHSFTAPKGSIIIEDTRGFHKGSHVSGNSRLVLQLQFSNSLFGANYKQAQMQHVKSPAMKKMLDFAPSIYRHYR